MGDQDKAAQRSNIVLQLGMVLAPLNELAKRAVPPSSVEYLVASARGQRDGGRWDSEVSAFATFGDYRFSQLAHDITREPHNLICEMSGVAQSISDDAVRQGWLQKRLEQCQVSTIDAINRVPIEWHARLHDSNTPFSVYLRIRDAIGTARSRIHYFDRYLDCDFFHLYLRDVDRGVETRLVTTKGKSSFGVANVLSISKLAAAEFRDFKLVECQPTDLHDRNLRIDDKVFFLGTSIKDAGTQPTNFSPADSSVEGHRVLDAMLGKGSVVVWL